MSPLMKLLIRNKAAPVGILVLVLCVGFGATAEGAIFVKIPNIGGESIDANHDKWIDVLSINQSIKRLKLDATTRSATVVHQDAVFIKRIDKASPMIAEACLNGTVFDQVVIDYQSHFDNPFIWERIVMENVSVTSYTTGYNGNVTGERFSLNYEKIHWQYVPRPPQDGTAPQPVSFGWDTIRLIAFEPTVDPIPTPTAKPTIEPTPPIEPTPEPTARPTVQPIDNTVVLNNDLLTLLPMGFTQSAVLVQGIYSPSLITLVPEVFNAHLFPMVTFPDGKVLTVVLKGNLEGHLESMDASGNPSTMVLILINQEGIIREISELEPPDLSVGRVQVVETLSTLVNMSFDGNDQLNLLVLLRGVHPVTFLPLAQLALVTVTGPFYESSVEDFSLFH